MQTYIPKRNEDIDETINNMFDLSRKMGLAVQCMFNGIILVILDGFSIRDSALRYYFEQHGRQIGVNLHSPMPPGADKKKVDALIGNY